MSWFNDYHEARKEGEEYQAEMEKNFARLAEEKPWLRGLVTTTPLQSVMFAILGLAFLPTLIYILWQYGRMLLQIVLGLFEVE